MTDDRETQAAEMVEALDHARELHDEFPHLTVETILTALDDEYAGSSIFPSGDETFRGEVEKVVR